MKLALIGKNISHSRSPEIYKNILGQGLTLYDLLDFQKENLIPSAIELLKNYNGISITSPYKSHFIDQAQIVNCPLNIPGINCLRSTNNKIEASNTDFLAIKYILQNSSSDLIGKDIAILGDGIMSKITELVLRELKYPYKIYSRKLTEQFNQLVFKNTFLINTCSREFVFSGKLEENVVFWDYNYNFNSHVEILPKICSKYVDGNSLLELQAKYAVEFFTHSNR
jgi:shikimate dehydrogenase